MKIKIAILILFGLMGACSQPVINNNATLVFKQGEYDFEEIETNSDAQCTFTFTNTGKNPLVIQNVKTTCGCTVPEWTRKPVKAGKNGEIIVTYNTTHPGRFNKTITVFYNGKNSPETLTIKGTVKYPDQQKQ